MVKVYNLLHGENNDASKISSLPWPEVGLTKGAELFVSTG